VMDERVELLREPRPEVMAPALGFGPVDDPDRALQPRLVQGLDPLVPGLQIQPEAPGPGFVEQRLVAALEARAHATPLGGIAPVAGRGHLSGMGGEADRVDLA